MTYNKLNTNDFLIKVNSGLIILLFLLILRVFLIYKQTQFNLTNPLIPKDLVCEVFNSYVDGGIFLLLGLFLVYILKSFNLNFISFLVSLLSLFLYIIFF